MSWEGSNIKRYLLLNLLEYLNDILGAENQSGSCCPDPINQFLEIVYFEYCLQKKKNLNEEANCTNKGLAVLGQCGNAACKILSRCLTTEPDKKSRFCPL